MIVPVILSPNSPILPIVKEQTLHLAYKSKRALQGSQLVDVVAHFGSQ